MSKAEKLETEQYERRISEERNRQFVRERALEISKAFYDQIVPKNRTISPSDVINTAELFAYFIFTDKK